MVADSPAVDERRNFARKRFVSASWYSTVSFFTFEIESWKTRARCLAVAPSPGPRRIMLCAIAMIDWIATDASPIGLPLE